MKKIMMNQTIHEILQVEPNLLQVLIDLGFGPLANPLTLKSVGKVMTLEKAVDHIGLDKNILKASFLEMGVSIDE